MDHNKVTEFLGRVVADMGATDAAGSVVIGHRLGLYRALAQAPATPDQLAERAQCHPRYVTEWLRGQAAGGYLGYNPATGEFSLSEEQAFCLADPNGPNVPAAFLTALGMLRAEPQITEAFRTGAGFAWHEHHEDVFTGCDAFYRPGYVAELVPNWIPALDGLEAKLTAGASVADVGCGLGSSSVLLTQTYPNSSVVGSDYHAESIELARKHAAEAGVADRITFEVASAQSFSGTDYDLVMTFDCLHDMGDPLAVARHAARTIAREGTVMLVEPYAKDGVGDSISPVARMYYAASTTICCAHAISDGGHIVLGAQAGEKRLAEIFRKAGFTRFRRAMATPFNLVLEARL